MHKDQQNKKNPVGIKCGCVALNCMIHVSLLTSHYNADMNQRCPPEEHLCNFTLIILCINIKCFWVKLNSCHCCKTGKSSQVRNMPLPRLFFPRDLCSWHICKVVQMMFSILCIVNFWSNINVCPVSLRHLTFSWLGTFSLIVFLWIIILLRLYFVII